jgi:hypothetical protein
MSAQLRLCIQVEAMRYLIEKQGSNGKDIKYTEIQIAEYLTPLAYQIQINVKYLK